MLKNNILNEVDDPAANNAEKIVNNSVEAKNKISKADSDNIKDNAAKVVIAQKDLDRAKKGLADAKKEKNINDANEKNKPPVNPSIEPKNVNADTDLIAMFSKELGMDPSKIDKNSDKYYKNGKIKKNMIDIDDVLTEDSVIFEDFSSDTYPKRIVYTIIAFYKDRPNEDIVYQQIKDDLFASLFITFDLSLKNCYTMNNDGINFLRINLLSESRISYVKMFISFLPLANQQWLSEVFTNNLDLQKINNNEIDDFNIFLDTIKKLEELNYSNIVISKFITNLFKLVGQEMREDFKAYLIFNGTLLDYNTLENKRLVQSLTTNAIPISSSINFFTNNLY